MTLLDMSKPTWCLCIIVSAAVNLVTKRFWQETCNQETAVLTSVSHSSSDCRKLFTCMQTYEKASKVASQKLLSYLLAAQLEWLV